MTATVSMSLRDEMLRWYFLDTTGPLFVALTYDVAPSNAALFMLNEVWANEYARAPLPRGMENWQASGFGEVQNLQTTTFPKAELDWGLINGWALLDHETEGEVKASGSLLTPIFVVETMQPVLAARSLIIALED
jgi:hypothetical protein